MLAIGVILVPLWAVYITEWKSPVKKHIRLATKPKDNWGPKAPGLKNEWKKFKADRQEQREVANKITCHGRFQRFFRAIFGSVA